MSRLPLRVLVSGNYLIMYEVKEEINLIEIDKIYHSKQNYIKRMFPDFQYNLDEEDLEQDFDYE